MYTNLCSFICFYPNSGVGYAICFIDVYMGMYYNTIIGWAVYYLWESFTYELPWTSCNNTWNTPFCKPVTQHANFTNATSPAREFFEYFLFISKLKTHYMIRYNVLLTISGEAFWSNIDRMVWTIWVLLNHHWPFVSFSCSSWYTFRCGKVFVVLVR